MAIDSANKRRNIAMVYYVPDGAIDTEAERKAVAFIYKTAVEVLITALIHFIAKDRMFRNIHKNKVFRFEPENKVFRQFHKSE